MKEYCWGFVTAADQTHFLPALDVMEMLELLRV